MVDNTGRIGGGGGGGPRVGGPQASRRQVPGLEGRVSGQSSGKPLGTPDGPRGRRMLSPDTPIESLEYDAPRGTYLDILV